MDEPTYQDVTCVLVVTWLPYFLQVVTNQNDPHLQQLWLVTVEAWWRHQMETFSALVAICAGNSPVTGEFPAQRPVTRSFDVFFDLRQNKRLSKQLGCW